MARTPEVARRPVDLSQYELSVAHDIRPLVVSTVLTYLELDGVIQATAPFYTGYKFQYRTPREKILDAYDPARAEFLRRLFSAARAGRTWHSLTTGEVSLELGEPRERIVAALTFLEEKGDLVVRAAGLRHGYRRLDAGRSVDDLARVLADRFQEREGRDVERLRGVVALGRARRVYQPRAARLFRGGARSRLPQLHRVS